MSAGTKIAGAAQAVENACSAAVKDFEEGIGSFLTGDHARTHDPKPVEELDADGRTKKQAEAAEREGQLKTDLTDLTTTQQNADQQKAEQQPTKETDNGYGL